MILVCFVVFDAGGAFFLESSKTPEYLKLGFIVTTYMRTGCRNYLRGIVAKVLLLVNGARIADSQEQIG